MNYVKQLLKSKTIKFNVLGGALVTILSAFDVDVTPEAVTAISVIGNILFRILTTEAISKKK